METPRETLISDFSDGKSPTGIQFKLLIESIISRSDDGIDKGIDTALKVKAGKEAHAPAISICPKDAMDPQWIVSLKAFGMEGLNFGQGDNPTNPVLYLDKATSNVGIGTNVPGNDLEVFGDINGEVGVLVHNPNEGDQAYVIHRLKTAGGEGVLFKNSSTRAANADGGPNTMTLRNDAGDLRVQAKDKSAIMLKSDTGFVGINNANPSLPLDVNGAMSLNANNLLFSSLRGGIAGYSTATGLFWHSENMGPEILAYGIYKTAGAWTANTFQQLRMQFDTGIQLGAGTGNNAGFGKSYVEVVNGKGLMVTSGNVGVGTTIPAGKVHVITAASDGDVAVWGNGQFVVGQEAANGPTSGGIGLSYSPTANMGFISSLSPSTSWRDLGLRSRNTIFYTGGTELMRLQADGKLGLGINAPAQFVHFRRDANEGVVSLLSNKSNGGGAFVATYWENDTPAVGVIFKNSSTRGPDGGPNTMTVRNDGGDLRLQSIGNKGLMVKATTGYVGAGTELPLAPVSIGTAQGKEDGPDASMHITNDCILFGGNNAGKELNSAQISAGKHIANSLNILGMSSTPSAADRRIDFWAEGGMYLQVGNFALGNGPALAPISIYNPNGKEESPDAAMHITSDCILFGGRNAGKETNSAQISAGKHVANSLCIVGMSSAPNVADRRIDLWAELGMHLNGPFGINSGITNSSQRPNVVNGRTFGELNAFSSQGLGADDGFLRISAGGGTSAGVKAYIDISGYSTIPDMYSNIVLGTGGAERMRILSDGNVGIGTKTSKHKLQINGGHMAFYASDDAGQQNANGYANLGSIFFYGHGRNVGNDSARITCGSPTWDDQGFLSFYTSNDGAAATEKMRIGIDGRVGIGTGAPAAMLHVATTGKVVDGQGLLLGKLNDAIRVSSTPGEVLGMIDLAFAGYRDSEPNQVGAKISAIRIANYGAPNSHLVQATELGFFTTSGSTGPQNLNLHETCAERLRIKQDGKIGIGTTIPTGKVHVVTSESNGNVAVWDGGQLVVGLEAGSGPASGGLGLSYSTANNAGYISSLSPNQAWRELGFRANSYSFNYGGSAELMKILNNGFVGIGVPNPLAPLSIGAGGAGKENFPDGSMHLTNDCILFGGNNAGRQADSAQISAARHQANSLCILGMSDPNGNNRRVDMWAEGGFLLRGGNLSIGGPANAAPAAISIYNGGKEDTPDGGMHITNNCIMFGGNNGAGKEMWSAQISAAKHAANSLCIVGMAGGGGGGDRRIDLWADGRGMNLQQGNFGIGANGGPVPAPISIYNGAGKEDSPDAAMHITNDCILFGGNNAGREWNSAQISAGRHQANSLCIVGMSDPGWGNRRVDMWAEGGFNLYGNLGIGTTSSVYPIHVARAVSSYIPGYGYLNRNGPGTYGAATAGVSIWCADRVVASEFNAISDIRTKKNISQSNAIADLERLQKITVNDYQYRDFVGKGDRWQKGFVAQEVVQHFPEAVATHTDFVPNIFAPALKVEVLTKKQNDADAEKPVDLGTEQTAPPIVNMMEQDNQAQVIRVTMEKAHNLKSGDVVRMYSKKGFAELPVIVKNTKVFSVEGWTYDTEDLFIYGSKVDDFMVVDYNRIYSLNVSATQELNRQLESVKAENEKLLKQVEAIKKALGTLNISFEA